jgi:Phytanoyl-CoA dioxygenase (PhyH)
MAVNKSGMLKVAGLSLIGFCAVSIGVDRANLGPIASQIAGFSGALLGGLAARRAAAAEKSSVPPPAWAAEFRRDGYVCFPQLVPAQLVDAARAKITQCVANHYDESKLVEYNNRSWCPELRRAPEILRLLNNPEVRPVLDAALGKRRYHSSPGQIAIRQARSAEHPTEPVPHIDGIPTPENGLKGNDLQTFTALVGVFLTEVKVEFAGNFTVWPGSHTLLEQYFKQRGGAALTEGMPAIPLGAPVQLLCKPGDVVFCHYQLAHTAAVNVSADDRIAVFFRVSLKDLATPRRRWHNLTNIWHGWQI